jgi:hypothetical protein
VNRCVRLLLAAAGLVTTSLAAATGPELPSWDDQERKHLEDSGWLPGADLLPDETAPAEPSPLDLDPPTREDLAVPAAPAPPIPEAALATYFAARPASYLIDPQGLLEATASRDGLAALERHAGDSTIDLFIYVFAAGQEIPGEMREEELIESFFTDGRPAVVVYYFFGQPEESFLYLSPSITEVINAVEQRRALQSAVMQAQEKAVPSEQLQAFITQMGIRIYGMERMLGGDPAAITEVPSASRPQAATSAKAPKRSGVLAPLLAQTRLGLEAYLLPAVGSAAVLALLAGLGLWWRYWARYRLPEFEVEPRLGGDHAAGVGAVISFASPTLPPASQRNQIPDYLRRS